MPNSQEDDRRTLSIKAKVENVAKGFQSITWGTMNNENRVYMHAMLDQKKAIRNLDRNIGLSSYRVFPGE